MNVLLEIIIGFAGIISIFLFVHSFRRYRMMGGTYRYERSQHLFFLYGVLILQIIFLLSILVGYFALWSHLLQITFLIILGLLGCFIPSWRFYYARGNMVINFLVYLIGLVTLGFLIYSLFSGLGKV